MNQREQYYKIAKTKQEYLGVKFFRLRHGTDTVLQVVYAPGNDQRKGRTNSFGAYLISRQTLFMNYLAMNYAEPCSKREFDKHFDKVIEMLK